MALLLPIFALLLVITVDFGRAFFTYIQITNAAREGAAYAATVPADTAGITARAQQERNVQSQGGENAMTVAVTCVDSAGSPITCASSPGGAGAGNRITVAISEPFTPATTGAGATAPTRSAVRPARSTPTAWMAPTPSSCR